MNALSIIILAVLIGLFVGSVVAILSAIAMAGRVSQKQRDLYGGQWDDDPR